MFVEDNTNRYLSILQRFTVGPNLVSSTQRPRGARFGASAPRLSRPLERQLQVCTDVFWFSCKARLELRDLELEITLQSMNLLSDFNAFYSNLINCFS